MNRKQRRQQYSVPSRSKPYCKTRRPLWKASSAQIGLDKIVRFIMHGIQHNTKYIVVRKDPLASAVSKAVRNG